MGKAKECYDHLGNRFESYAEMCRYYGKTVSQVIRRENLGWSREKALNESVRGKSSGCLDHLGNRFNTVKEMCEHYGQDISTYKSRRNNGVSIEEALTLPNKHFRENVDHLGNKYSSTTDMCNHYSISICTYINRRKKGWSIKDALTKDVAVGRSKKNKDTFGNTYNSIAELCNVYCIKYGVYKERERFGWDIDECIGISKRGLDAAIRNKEIINTKINNIKRAYTGIDNKVYYICNDRDTGEELLLNADEILMYKQKDYKTAVEQLIQRRRNS